MKKRSAFIVLAWLCTFALNAQNVTSRLPIITGDRQKADTLLAQAMKQFYRGTFDSAAYFINKGIPFAEKTGDNQWITYWYLTLGNTYILNNKGAEGLAAIKNATPYLSRISSYDLEIKYLVFSGMAFEKLHQADSAMYYFHKGEQLNNHKDPYKNWIVYAQIGLMFQQAEVYKEAEQFFDKAYTLTKNKGVRTDHGIMLYRFANLYYRWGKAQKFAELVNEQQQFLQGSKKKQITDPVHSMLFVDWDSKPLDEKVAFMENVKTELLKNSAVNNAALANVYIAEFYETANQPAKGLKYTIENEKLLSSGGDINNQYVNTKLMYRLLKKSGNEKAAVHAADKLFMLKDSIIKLQQVATLFDLETKYETDKKEKDIIVLNAKNQLSSFRLAKETDLKEALIRENRLKDSVVKRAKDFSTLMAGDNNLRKKQLANEKALQASLSRENDLKSIQLTQEKSLRWQLILLAFLLFTSCAIIFIIYRKQKSKNSIIQRQADDMQVLMREIHHRVKNNLQVISSLLDLQSLSIKDPQASEAIKESRNRVYSMALIHQNLYKEENIIGIEMNNYINKLAQSLFQSYNSGEHNIVLETDIDHLLLDVDMVIPIGLVLNELISNSLKYAFNGNGSGTLQIALKKSGDEMLLKVKDDGAGFPTGINVFTSQSFGFKLIKAFAQKLKAKLEVYNDNGACILLHIKKIKFA